MKCLLTTRCPLEVSGGTKTIAFGLHPCRLPNDIIVGYDLDIILRYTRPGRAPYPKQLVLRFLEKVLDYRAKSRALVKIHFFHDLMRRFFMNGSAFRFLIPRFGNGLLRESLGVKDYQAKVNDRLIARFDCLFNGVQVGGQHSLIT